MHDVPYIPAHGTSRAAVVLVPGLNLALPSLHPLAQELARAGADVFIAPLRENSDPVVNSARAQPADWIADVDAALDSARTAGSSRPVVAVGYSLGATVLIEHAARAPARRADGYVLLAPATALRLSARILRAVLSIAPDSGTLFSFAPHEYRARSTTPIGHYRALFELMDAIRDRTGAEPIAERPGVIVANPRDELVSTPAVKRWASTALPGWGFRELSTRSELCPRLKHLFIDRRSAGAEPFEQLVEEITALIDLTARAPLR